MTISIRSSLLQFSIWLIVTTAIFGLIAMITIQSGLSVLIPFFSMSIMLPYMVSFYLMTKHFIKKYQTVPNKKQRWLLSFSCIGIFWAISLFAGLVSMYLSGADFSHIDGGALVFFVLIFGAYIIGINLLLVVLGYFFLGKPATMMLSHHERL